MEETVAGVRVFNRFRIVSTFLLLVFTSTGAAQVQLVLALSIPGGLLQSCHRDPHVPRPNVKP